MNDRCPECGMEGVGGTWECRALFEALLAQEWDHPTSYRAHRMMVDAYCLQHPVEYCASAKSFAAHLTSMCCAMEHNSNAHAMRALQQWLSGKTAVVRPNPPAPGKRGELTLMEVYRGQDPVPRVVAIKGWAQATWQA